MVKLLKVIQIGTMRYIKLWTYIIEEASSLHSFALWHKPQSTVPCSNSNLSGPGKSSHRCIIHHPCAIVCFSSYSIYSTLAMGKARLLKIAILTLYTRATTASFKVIPLVYLCELAQVKNNEKSTGCWKGNHFLFSQFIQKDQNNLLSCDECTIEIYG